MGEKKKNYKNKIKSRRAILIWFAIIALFLSGCFSKPKIYRIGILSGSDAFINIADGFKVKMTELGYIEGKNVIYDMQSLNADPAGERKRPKNLCPIKRI